MYWLILQLALGLNKSILAQCVCGNTVYKQLPRYSEQWNTCQTKCYLHFGLSPISGQPWCWLQPFAHDADTILPIEMALHLKVFPIPSNGSVAELALWEVYRVYMHHECATRKLWEDTTKHSGNYLFNSEYVSTTNYFK